MPRSVDKPANRIEDIHGMADYLSQYPGVDSKALRIQSGNLLFYATIRMCHNNGRVFFSRIVVSWAANAADYKKNPFTLVYDGAITENVIGKVNIHPVKALLRHHSDVPQQWPGIF
jgi:hypothetical protein